MTSQQTDHNLTPEVFLQVSNHPNTNRLGEIRVQVVRHSATTAAHRSDVASADEQSVTLQSRPASINQQLAVGRFFNCTENTRSSSSGEVFWGSSSCRHSEVNVFTVSELEFLLHNKLS